MNNKNNLKKFVVEQLDYILEKCEEGMKFCEWFEGREKISLMEEYSIPQFEFILTTFDTYEIDKQNNEYLNDLIKDFEGAVERILNEEPEFIETSHFVLVKEILKDIVDYLIKGGK